MILSENVYDNDGDSNDKRMRNDDNNDKEEDVSDNGVHDNGSIDRDNDNGMVMISVTMIW